MCGICGFIGIEEDGLLERMTEALHHRGPDDCGCFAEGDVGLGHKRLSIIDLAGGHQPMFSPDGNLVIVFNGEIYNFAELRQALIGEGQRFATSSDTEVLLRLYQLEGAGALQKLNGMFAFAVYDRGRRELFLARDRVGIKPLYFVHDSGRFLFASETKSLMRYSGWRRTLNAHAIADYLKLRYVPGSTGMFQEVQRLPPGHYLRFKDGEARLNRYWSPPIVHEREERSEQDYEDELARLLRTSVRRRLITDVSFGAYLSGGLDSSVIVALMSEIVSAPIKTFSVGFDYEHDELSQAAATARLLGCDHTEIACRPSDLALLPDVVYHSDEPLGDAISIPMFMLAREAKKQVTVILTGEGADEIFAGYLFHKVLWGGGIYRRRVPSIVRRRMIRPLLALTPAAVMNVAFRYPAYLGRRGKLKALDYVDLLEHGTLDESYRHLISLFDARETDELFTREFEGLLREQTAPWTPRASTAGKDSAGEEFDRMLRLQFGHWLPDNMLLRQDKVSMASAIEGRVPYLDHEVIDFAFRLPRKLRLRRLVGKHLLRRLAADVLPKETAERRKMPFYVPVENYFTDPVFMELVDDLLGEDSVRRRGIFRPEAVARLHGSLRRREFLLVKQVFSLLTLELWFRIFVDRDGTRVSDARRATEPAPSGVRSGARLSGPS